MSILKIIESSNLALKAFETNENKVVKDDNSRINKMTKNLSKSEK